MNTYINIGGIVLTSIGIVLSLWSIITTKTSSVGTCEYQRKEPERFSKEKKLVIIGCVFIILGAVMQIVALLI